ncbi:MAG: ABC transporter ATP-binding protein [candidate division WOR-3 bacterium]|nr:MAG: ABC transporter ATP-binding protein [candidate division WOR-3 bacterium]
MNDSILSAVGLGKTYYLQNETIDVLEGVDLEVRRGGFVVILGPSGSGKSTLLHIISGLDNPTAGKVVFDSTDITKHDDNRLSEIRNKKMGFVFQFHHLLAEFSCLENVALPALVNGIAPQAAYDKAQDLLEKFSVGDKRNRLPDEISGGERQRVAIARAMINDPLIIFADEPTGNLDEGNTNKLLDVFGSLKDEGRTLVLVTHSLDIARVGSDVYKLKERRLYAV